MTSLHLIDFDTVEAVNLAPQGYLEDDLGRPMVRATADLCHRINHQFGVVTANDRFRRHPAADVYLDRPQLADDLLRRVTLPGHNLPFPEGAQMREIISQNWTGVRGAGHEHLLPEHLQLEVRYLGGLSVVTEEEPMLDAPPSALRFQPKSRV